MSSFADNLKGSCSLLNIEPMIPGLPRGVPFIELGRSGEWMVWHGLAMIAMRVIIVWLFVNNGQSVFIAALFHSMSNIPYGILPNYGSYYDPFLTFLILAIAVEMIVSRWDRTKLARLSRSGNA